ncbi:MAG: zf-TFIIB domain-containing protein [Gemmatimonadota bacterium]
MTKLETRHPCPVCLGATLEKSWIEGSGRFSLDHCTRCGGAWFDHGEVHRLRMCDPTDLWRHMAQRTNVHAMQCHSCDHLLAREEEMCPACGWHVQLDCPVCGEPMMASKHAGVILDACRRCKGVWFDHHELASLWKAEFMAALQRWRVPAAGEGGGAVLEALAWDPFLVYYAGSAAGHVLSAGASGAPGVIEAAGEAATSVFETIVEIIAGFFG